MLGVHVSKQSHILDDKTPADELADAIVRDTTKLDLNSAQIFTHGPRFIKPNKIDYNKLVDVTKDIELSVHSAYPTVSIWNVNKKNKSEELSKKYIQGLKMQLMSCVKALANNMVLHIKRVEPEAAAETMQCIKHYVLKTNVTLLLEMISSKAHPTLTYETPEKVNNLTKLIDAKTATHNTIDAKPEKVNNLTKLIDTKHTMHNTNDTKPDKTVTYTTDWWGWCVDTAHLWGAGVDITSYESMRNWLNKIERKDKIKMFHLNGSSAARGSGQDKHQAAFTKADLIWYNVEPKKSGVRAVMEFAIKYNIPVICEINTGSEKNITYSLQLIKSLIS